MRKLTMTFLAAATILGTVVVAPSMKETQREVAEEVAGGAEKAGDVAGSVTKRIVVRSGGTKSGAALSRCGGDGGASDRGVASRKINLASTVVQSGIGATFLSSSPIAMKSVLQRVNKGGGVCSRILDLNTVNDGWDAQRGLTYIRNFIRQDYFALPVVPSSEGLTAAIESGDISKAGIPVVGTDGMLIQQYENPWVWPVATATVSTMRIMARYAYYEHEKKSRSFALVYDRRYRFGREGAKAFADYVKKLPGAKLKAFVGIQPGQPSYGTDIQQFNDQCSSGCDFIGYLLEPGTAETWFAGRPVGAKMLMSGAQTLFNERFAKNCGNDCDGMFVWTGYNPPIGGLASLPDVRKFVNDVKSVSPTIDTTNQFLEGAYLGMSVFVEAVRRAGPNLTREKLKSVLDNMCYKSDLASTLCWSPTRRHANIRAQAFSIVVAQGSFSGFRNERTGWVVDPKFD